VTPATVSRIGACLAWSSWPYHREPFGDALLCALMDAHATQSLTWFLAFDGYEKDVGIATLSLWVMPTGVVNEYTTVDTRHAAHRCRMFVDAWIAGWHARGGAL
jgi:hypothetical protein